MHISYSKTNKYDYTPLQFAKSLFDRMMLENGVASESKVLLQHQKNLDDLSHQNGYDLNSFNTTNVCFFDFDFY